MSHDPLAPIWTRLENPQPVFLHDDLDRTLAGGRDWLVRTGVLVETTPSLHGQCVECGNGHLVRAVCVPDARTGRNEWRLPCPTCGSVPINGNSLRRWVIDVPALLARVCAAAGIRDARGAVIENHLWLVGTAPWGCPARSVYFARATHARTRASAVAALAAHPRAVLLHPTEDAAWRWGAATPNPAVALESVVGLGPDGLKFDTGAVADRLADAPGAPRPKPPRKREERAAKIEALVTELRHHLRGAHDRAVVTRGLTGTPQFLPRPSQQELAVLCGLTETDVSRCLRDPEAVLLRLLWETAADIDRIIAWDGSVGGDPP